MKTAVLTLLLALPFFVAAQTSDSLIVIKQIDSLLRQLRPLIEQQKLDAALEILNFAEEKSLATFGKNHAAFAACLAFRGKIAQREEKYKEAEALYLDAMSIQEKVFGKQSPQYAISLSNLSTVYLTVGEFAKAEPVTLEALAIREKLVGKQHPDYARMLGTLGSINFQKGFYGEAEFLYLEALAVFEKTLGKKHPEYAFVLGNLTRIYTLTGNYAKVESLMLEVNDILAATYGKQNPLYIQGLINLAKLYSNMGNDSKAESLNLELKEILSNEEGKASMNYATVLQSLALIYLNKGEYIQAEPLVYEAEALTAKILGKKNTDYAWVLTSLGVLYTAKSDFTRAESMFLKALDAVEGDYSTRIQTMSLLALLYQQTGRVEEASVLFLEVEALNRVNTERAAGYSSEIEMFQYLEKFRQNTDQFYSFAQAHTSLEIAGAAYNNALFYKGFLLNATLQVKNRAHLDSATVQKFAILRAYHRRLAEQYALPGTERNAETITLLEDSANTLEKELARTMVGYGDALRQVNWKEVQAVLKPREAAIEFIDYRYQNTNGKPADSTFYAAVVLGPEDKAPVFVPLFEERALTTLIQGASGGNFRKINNLYSADSKGQNALNELIWKKLEAPLKNAGKVYCSRSGLLHQLNLGAIPLNAMETFAGRRELVLLGSTRQLVIRDQSAVYNSEALLVGGVNYTENDAAIANANQRLAQTRGLPDLEIPLFEADSLTRSNIWGFLPSTVTEVLDIRRILQSSEMQVQLDTGYAATEESIKQSGSFNGEGAPRILHFATHGYFFPDPKNAFSSTVSREQIAFKASENPLLRSGLILAGAQKIWTGGKLPAGREDGVLTAFEISLLNLSGTELVVLSACETGLGDIEGNEGVYGLQRALKIAGAKYIVMSLWKVNDLTTSEFMKDFYTQWLKKHLDIPNAFRKAQLNLKLKYPLEPYHWAGFILVE